MLAAHHWRFLRAKLVTAGISDPMTLTSLHTLLDIVESTVLESMHKETDRKIMLNKLYTPELTQLNGDGYQPAPAGFEEEDVEASFDAFMASAR